MVTGHIIDRSLEHDGGEQCTGVTSTVVGTRSTHMHREMADLILSLFQHSAAASHSEHLVSHTWHLGREENPVRDLGVWGSDSEFIRADA